MNQKKIIKEVIVVEGKTDTRKLQSIFDVETIETNGTYLSHKTINLIKLISLKKDIVLMLDPDAPGKNIKTKLKKILSKYKEVNVLTHRAKFKNKVGIAHLKNEDIINNLSTIVNFISKKTFSISYDEYQSLTLNSKLIRNKISDYFNIPYTNSKTLYKWLNLMEIDCKNIKKILKNN